MKKVFFSVAIATLMGVALAACGNKSGNGNDVAADSTATAEPTEAVVEEAPVKTEDRPFYTVDVPAPWEAKQYVSEMVVKKDGAELNFKEGAKSNVADWAANIAPAASAQLDDITTGDITWSVYQNAQSFKTVYLAQVGDGVVRVGSSLEDANDADVLKVLAGVKVK